MIFVIANYNFFDVSMQFLWIHAGWFWFFQFFLPIENFSLASSFHLHRKRFLSLFLASYLLLGPACCIFPERHPTWAFMTDIDRVLLIWLTIIPFSLSDPPPSLPSDKTWNLSLDMGIVSSMDETRRMKKTTFPVASTQCASSPTCGPLMDLPNQTGSRSLQTSTNSSVEFN